MNCLYKVSAGKISVSLVLLILSTVFIFGCGIIFRKKKEKLKVMNLTIDGKSDYRIVISNDASPSEKHAADELQEFLRQISGANLPIVTDEVKRESKEIILGNNKHLAQLGVEVDFDRLGDEGFSIKTVGDSLVIAGGRLRGTMYGVYTFLEDYLGCRQCKMARGILKLAPAYRQLV